MRYEPGATVCLPPIGYPESVAELHAKMETITKGLSVASWRLAK
jgi:hypothetical protein